MRRWRLVGFVLAFVVVGVGLGWHYLTGPRAGEEPSTVRPSATSPAPTAEPEEVELAIRQYLTAFLNTDVPYEEWQKDVYAHATGHLTAQLNGVDVDAIPDTTLARVRVTGTTEDYAEAVAVFTDGTRVEVAAILSGGQWRVDEVQER